MMISLVRPCAFPCHLHAVSVAHGTMTMLSLTPFSNLEKSNLFLLSFSLSPISFLSRFVDTGCGLGTLS